MYHTYESTLYSLTLYLEALASTLLFDTKVTKPVLQLRPVGATGSSWITISRSQKCSPTLRLLGNYGTCSTQLLLIL